MSKPLSDYKFPVHAVRNAYRYRAMRAAVFFPVFGHDWFTHDVVDLLDDLRRRWKKRLRSLAKAGWQPTSSGKSLLKVQYQYLRNCPPFGVKTSVVSKPCSRPLICPFCWARAFVQTPFMRMEALLYGVTDPKAKPRYSPDTHVLVEHVWVWKITSKSGTSADWTDMRFRGSLSQLAIKMATAKHRSLDVKHYGKHDGAFMLYRLEMQDAALVLRRCSVVLVDKRVIVDRGHPLYEPPYRSYVKLHPPTKKALAEIMGRVGAYPVSVLTEAPQRVSDVLKVLHGRRMYTYYPPRSKPVLKET